MELKKVQKQGRDERMQEDYPTSGVYFCRCRVVFLRSFISALFLYFFQLHPYLKSSFTETFFPSKIYQQCQKRKQKKLEQLIPTRKKSNRRDNHKNKKNLQIVHVLHQKTTRILWLIYLRSNFMQQKSRSSPKDFHFALDHHGWIVSN